jgi:endonuclease/exonuclease/phosphatase family metal-dependent hydrolase
VPRPATLVAQTASRPPLTVMSYNIRYGDAPDGEDRWQARRAMLFGVIREQNADVVGLQEALTSQIREIVQAVPGYAVVGVGRDDGRAGGEHTPILFSSARLRVAAAGTFWLSDTPDVPRSTSWGNQIARICTWARFVDRDGRAFWHYNVHLDHESQPSRERSTELMRARIASRPTPDEPVLITGDFNAGEKNPAVETLLGGTSKEPLFIDTFRVLHASETDVGTYNAFTFGQTGGEKIDYILVPPGTEVLEADIIRTSRNRRYPSDHFAVVAKVRLGTE